MRNVTELVHTNAPALLALMLNERETVFAYAKRWHDGERWEPIEVSPGGFVSDGNHRLAAAFYLNHSNIEVRETT